MKWLIQGPLRSSTADPGVASLNPVEAYAFVEIDNEMVDTRSLT